MLLSKLFVKRLLYIFGLLFLTVLTACEKKEILFEGPYHVRFTEPSASARESINQPVRISIHNAGPQLTTPITVKYRISGTAREGIDYEIEGTKGEVVIPANQSFGYIVMRLINNANNILESQNVIFTITEVTPNTLQIGRSVDGIIGKSTTFTIIDDCILSGSYTGITELFDTPPVSKITLSSSDCREYTLSNWNIGLFTEPSIPMNLTLIDNGDNSLTIPRQAEEMLSAPNDTIQGTGSINALNGRISLNIQFMVEIRENVDSLIVFPITLIPE